MSNFCTNCGAQIEEGQVCNCQENAQPVEQTTNTPPPASTPPPAQQNYQQQAPASDNSKIFKILSYIGILWLIGMFVSPEKDDPRVRFHVGQGIILTIVQIGLGIIIGIVNGILASIFVTSVSYYGYTIGSGVSGIGLLLTGLLSFVMWAIFIVLAIIGIINASKDVEKPLPIIGRWAFYK